MKWMTKQSIILAFALALVVGVVSVFPCLAQPAQDIPQNAQVKLASVESVTIEGEGEAAELVIKVSSTATYTSYKTTSPLRLVIDLSQTAPGKVITPVVLNKGNFKTVTVNRYDTDAGVLTRVDVELSKDADAVLTTSQEKPGEIRVTFPSLTVPTAANAISNVAQVASGVNKPENASALEKTSNSEKPLVSPITEPSPVVNNAVTRILTAVSVRDNSILLAIEGGASEFKSIRLDKPERYVVDLYDVKSKLASKIIPINSLGVSSARLGMYPDKVRVVFESMNGTLPEPITVKSAEGITISFKERPGLNSGLIAESTEDKTVEPIVKPEPIANGISPSKSEAVSAPISAKPTTQVDTVKKEERISHVSIDMIDFQVIDGLSRVSVKILGETSVDAPIKSLGFVTLTIKNAVLPKRLQHSLETKNFVSPVLRVTPILVKSRKSTDTKIRIAMRKTAPYKYRQEGDMLYIDFKNPEGITADSFPLDLQENRPPSSRASKIPSRVDSELKTELLPHLDSTARPVSSQKVYKGRRVTLEFSDAEVRKIFQLLSEVSNKNFVLGDDVTGSISIKLVNVPWDQALDIILDSKGLDKREEGNIVIIKAKGKFKSQAEEDRELKKAQLKATELVTKIFTINYANLDDISTQFKLLTTEGVGASVNRDIRTNKIIVNDIPESIKKMGEILKELDIPEKQVMIEARIIEATTTFTQTLGVSWGLHYKDQTGTLVPGLMGVDTTFGGQTSAPATTGVGTGNGALGMTFGLGNVGISVQLNAAATAGLVKTISNPKIATLNNKTAKITQGDQIPYISSTSDKTETKFILAALSLEVTPHINPDGTISMKIDAKNDQMGSLVTAGSSTAPAITTKQASTEMLLKDGETVVIGGIYKDDDHDTDSGTSFLMDIPVLGKLFKSNVKSKTKSELLVFITPRIM